MNQPSPAATRTLITVLLGLLPLTACDGLDSEVAPERVRAALTSSPDGGSGDDNLVENGDFTDSLKNWTVGIFVPGTATIMATSSKSHDAAPAIRIKNALVQDFYKVQFYQEHRHIDADRCYHLSFWAMASAPRKISAQVYKGASDWRSYGLWEEPTLTTSWVQYNYDFISTETADDARVGFNFGAETATVWLDDVVLTDTGDGDSCP